MFYHLSVRDAEMIFIFLKTTSYINYMVILLYGIFINPVSKSRTFIRVCLKNAPEKN